MLVEASDPLRHVMLEDPPRLNWPSRFHAVQFYANEEYLIRSSFSFVLDGQKTNGTVVVIATEAHCMMLKKSVQHLDQGKLILANAEEVLSQFMIDDRPDQTRLLQVFGEIQKQVTPGSRLFLFGELAPMLCSQGLHPAAIILEQLAGVLSTEYGVSILCGYPHSLYEQNDTNLISGIHRSHTHLQVAGSIVPLH